MMPPRFVLFLITCITCLGFAPSSVGTTATQEREAPQRNPGVERTNNNLFSASPVPLVVAQAIPKPFPNPTDTLPSLEGPKPAPKQTPAFEFLSNKWSLAWIGAAVVFFAIAGGLYYLQRRYDNQPEPKQQKPLPDSASPDVLDIDEFEANFGSDEIESGKNGYNTPISPLPEHYLGASKSNDANNGSNPFTALPEQPDPENSQPQSHPEQSAPQSQEENLPVQETTRITRVNIVDQLIRDLHNPDPRKRRKAIWELAQRGDSRAMQPLLDLLMDADSQQRSLILEALSQIGTRTLKPMNRALAVSLQDDNAEVRKNAIRDLTRMYESLGQLSQLLRHAVEDPDKEVQETARWALTQLSRIRTLSGMENRSSSRNPPNEF
ncbi:HEAT repeat domain-containing protein [Microseira wollei]|uniref:PBS lyase HEAT domain protein repeat-containing protein n=1 Tax=Microseira wollei NIES-4236 TaxID=2530354 RepID=A0AAV3XEH3_9CYAN|nr:HEAT repeat domain-containing protein [Microseira wollei]GET41342.1 PBS lyase HEAT domain protein repeat-containing protein [Microseira wollei NIES-4236]